MVVPEHSVTSSGPPAATARVGRPGRNGRVRHITLQIEQSGGKLIGSFSARRRAGKLSGSVHGNQVSLQMGADGRSITLTGTIDGNSMTVQGPRGGSCSASRH